MFAFKLVGKFGSKLVAPRLNIFRNFKKEAFLDYSCGTKARLALDEALENLRVNMIGVPVVIGEEKIFTGDEQFQKMPHNNKNVLSKFYYANKTHINSAIKCTQKTAQCWHKVSIADRVKIWNKCADIMEKEDRFVLMAAIMLGQGKMYKQAEEDVLRLVQSLRINAKYLVEIAKIKLTNDSSNIYSTFHLRPLDGFVAAIGPFNLLAVSADLAFTPALMGNCVLWKPSINCVLSSFIAFQSMLKAGLPQGVINFLPANECLFLDTIAESKFLAGINFTGKLSKLRHIWQIIAIQLDHLKNFPRIVGECGGKNFHLVHESANMDVVLDAAIKSAFDYSGQNCNSLSKMYVPESMWPELKCALQHDVDSIKVSDPTDYEGFTSAVINEEAFDRIVAYLFNAKKDPKVEVVCGGDFCKTLGYFIEPTVLLVEDPDCQLMREEILGPILCVYVYKNKELPQLLEIIKKTAIFGFSGSIFSNNDDVICQVVQELQMIVSNMYVNEKCTGSIEGHMPFGGNQLSGTNDKNGTPQFLLRWASTQLLEEVLPPKKK